MIIDIKKTCGKNIITREDGEAIRDIVFGNWNRQGKITLDFKNIQIASVSFIDEAFGMLAFAFSRDEMRNKLSFLNMDVHDKELLNRILISRFKQKEAGHTKENTPLAHA